MNLRAPWVALMLVLSLPAAQAAGSRPVLGAQEKVAGRSQSDYAIAWWRWVMRLPDGVRAYQDPSGAQCALNQGGPVWFLAGTEGTGAVQRECAVPAGTHLFLPVIAMLVHASPGHPLSCPQAQARARANNDHLAQVQVVLDGRVVMDVAAHRLRGMPCFDAFADAKYIERHAPYEPAATDGYWLMLAPLPAGLHQLSVKARYDNPGQPQGDLEEQFEYRLRVGDAPVIAPPSAGGRVITT